MTFDEFAREVDIGPFLFMVFIGTFILAIWLHRIRQKKLEEAKEKIYGYNTSNIPLTEHNVSLIEKTVSQYNVHADWFITVNYCIFQLTSGEKIRLAIESQEVYDLISIGDTGTLKYAGKKFIDFSILPTR